jgi:hypothetical protein
MHSLDARRTCGLPAPGIARHGKPKGRRRPRLPADGSGNLFLRRANLLASLSIRSLLRQPRGIAAPDEAGDALTESPERMPGPRRHCVPGMRILARRATSCAIRGNRSTCQVPTDTHRSTQTSVQEGGPYGTLPEASLTQRLPAHLVSRADGARDRPKMVDDLINVAEILVARRPGMAHDGGHCGRKNPAGKGLVRRIVDDACHHSPASLSYDFRGKSAARALVPGPLAGISSNRGPGTHAHSPEGFPSSSLETCACTRYVIRWSHLGYLSCGIYVTYYLSTCLATPASNVPRFPGGTGGQ